MGGGREKERETFSALIQEWEQRLKMVVYKS
jgi:hypothetical protein